MRDKHIGFLALVMIALSASGFTYAQWNDMITVNSIMSFGTENMGFVEPLSSREYHEDAITGELILGEYLGKDVGKCLCEYQELKTDIETGKEGYKKLVITLGNAYPGYTVCCNFTLEDIGSLPIHITNLLISDPSGILAWDSDNNALVNSDGDSIITIILNDGLICSALQPSDDPNTPIIDNQAEFEILIHIMQHAQECTEYAFEVQIIYEVVA